MSGVCPSVPTGGAFISEMLAHLDCQAQTIGAAGYQALASPTSPASIAVTSLLTIFVALFGFRMLLGHTPDVRDGVLAIVKVGLVLVLTSSWGAYRAVAYDVALYGPAQIAGTIGEASALPGANGGMTDRLQNVDDLILQFASIGSGQPLITGQADLSAVDRARAATPLVSDSFAFGIARTTYLVGTLGSLATLRIGAGILLALAPLFAGFLLFDATRGIFIGWTRALVAVAVGALATSLVLGVELAVLEPWLSDALSRRGNDLATPAAPGELLAITLIFGFVTFGVLALVSRLAFTLHVPAPWVREFSRGLGALNSNRVDALPLQSRSASTPTISRAALVSDAVARADRRETNVSRAVISDSSQVSRPSSGRPAGPESTSATAPVGRQFRSARPRISAGARRRDGSS
jgi:type IV secretion system protein VirB6